MYIKVLTKVCLSLSGHASFEQHDSEKSHEYCIAPHCRINLILKGFLRLSLSKQLLKSGLGIFSIVYT